MFSKEQNEEAAAATIKNLEHTLAFSTPTDHHPHGIMQKAGTITLDENNPVLDKILKTMEEMNEKMNTLQMSQEK